MPDILLKMSVKVLEKEFMLLKNEFTGVKSKIDDLIKKYSNLEKRYEKSITKQKKLNFKCKNCGEKLENLKELQKHKETSKCSVKLQCEECDKCFVSQVKLDEHVTRSHTNYECEECGKVFKVESILEKHNEAAHEDIKLYCYYFNNDKDCPYDDDDGCIYLHEDSQPCKFGSGCERQLCMFKHEKRDDDKSSAGRVFLVTSGVDMVSTPVQKV